MWHVLEHVHQLHEYMDQLHQVLKEDGVLFIAVPNHTSSDAKHYGVGWAAYDVPRHLYHFSPASMAELAGMHQFKLIGMKPMWFDSVYVSMLSEQYKHGKSRMMSALYHGLMSNIKAMGDASKCSSVIYMLKK